MNRIKTRPEKAEEPQTQGERVELLHRRIRESGLRMDDFARYVLTRDVRSVRRWRKGERPIPQCVMDFLIHPWKVPYPFAGRSVG